MSETAKPPVMRRRMRIVLFASLALNLVIVGLVVGVVANGGPPSRADHRDRDPVMPYTRAFDEKQRRNLRDAYRSSFAPRPGSGKPDLVAGYRQAVEVLRADPFDISQLTAVVGRQKAQADRRQKSGQDILTSFLAAMSPEERLAYADRLEVEIERMSSRQKRWHKD
jgi:uncharacterized membrane protein